MNYDDRTLTDISKPLQEGTRSESDDFELAVFEFERSAPPGVIRKVVPFSSAPSPWVVKRG